MTTDILMCRVNNEPYYDFQLTPEGDLVSGDFFDTAIYYSFLGERRANASEVPVSENRGGSLANINNGFENGSKVWLYYQARLTRTVLNNIRSAAFNGLKWMIDDRILQDINITVLVRDGAVVLDITLFRFNSKVDRRYFELWNNTGVC